MKTTETPRANKIGDMVAYESPYGQCYHSYSVPRDPHSQYQQRVRDVFRYATQSWGLRLTDEQRQRWAAAAMQVPSHPSLSQYGHLTGELLYVKIALTLSCAGQPAIDEPPGLVAFGPSPVSGLLIDYDAAGEERLRLSLSPTTEDIMLYGQAPCSPGRMKPRRVYYLGLLGLASDGYCDITAAYAARFGRPTPREKVFIVTRQERNGWQGAECVVSATAPPKPLPAG